MSTVTTTSYSIVRTVSPLAVGFVVGSIISLAVFPSLRSRQPLGEFHSPPIDECEPVANEPARTKPNRLEPREETAERYEAVIHAPLSVLNGKRKVRRPRFYATEFGIKDKLFVAALTWSTASGAPSVAFNQTVAHHVSRLAFFTDAEQRDVDVDLNLVHLDNMKKSATGTAPLPDVPPALLRYFRNKELTKNYDWFFVVPDTTYAKAFKLYEFVTHISIGDTVVMGRKSDDDTGRCDAAAGQIFSSQAVDLMINLMNECWPTEANSERLFQNCLKDRKSSVALLTCRDEWNGKTFKSRRLKKNEDVNSILGPAIDGALTVYPLSRREEFHGLHAYFCQVEIDQLTGQTGAIEDALERAQFARQDQTVANSSDYSWPSSLPPPWRPRNRYEVDQWQLFTETEIYKNYQHENSVPLVGEDKEDVTEVVQRGLRYLNEKESIEPNKAKFLFGYRLFDATRGMSYVLDFEVGSADEAFMERVQLVRPLQRAEILHTVPYVTEQTNLTLALPIRPDEAAAARWFLLRYAKQCAADVTPKRIDHLVLFPVGEWNEAGGVEPLASSLAADIDTVRQQCRHTTALTIIDNSSNEPTVDEGTPNFTTMEKLVRRFGADKLYLFMPPWAEADVEFLNRVRLNTILNFQIFLPVPFVEFELGAGRSEQVNEEDSQDEQQKPPSLRTLQVHKTMGTFDHVDYSIASFYGSDFQLAVTKLRQQENQARDEKGTDFAELFLKTADQLHVLRATEPGLRLRYHKKQDCDSDLAGDDYANCLAHGRHTLGTKAKLATIVLQ